MTDKPSFRALLSTFGRIGLLSFGGPPAQIGLMHRVLVAERGWLDEAQFLRALSFCMLLPGPEAMQLATYTGWRLRGTAGGLVAGLLFVTPGALVVAGLALAYVRFGEAPQMQAALLGIKAAVIVIVAQALARLASRALVRSDAVWLAVLAFLGLFLLSLPFPAVVLAAGLWGFLRAPEAVSDAPIGPTRGGLWRHALIWLTLWFLPLPILWAVDATLLFDLGLFFAKLAVLSFGGAYAVLAWMAQEAVAARAWLTAPQMLDALGLAETTPGPLILVTQFVGMIAGHAAGGVTLALAAGALTLWMTFVPCFLWIFTGAPFVEDLLARPRLASALEAITAAIVGVIASLSLWFAMHVLFARTRMLDFGPIAIEAPDFASLSPIAAGLVALGAICLSIARLGVPVTLGIAACAAWSAGRFGWIP